MARAHHHSELEKILVLAGGAGLAYYGWKQGWFAGLIPAAAPVATAIPDSPLLSPPVSIAPSGSEFSTSSPGAAATGSASGSAPATTGVLIPAVPLNSPDQVVGISNGTQIVTQQPAYGSDGSEVLPSNFATVNDPLTGLQPPTALVTASSSQQVVAVPTGAAVDPCANVPTYSLYKYNPANIGPNNLGSMMQGVQVAMNWLQQVRTLNPSAFNASLIASTFVVSPYPQGATQAAIASAIVGKLGGDVLIDISNPKQFSAAVAGLIAAQNGEVQAAAIPAACYLAAYNAEFGTSYSSF